MLYTAKHYTLKLLLPVCLMLGSTVSYGQVTLVQRQKAKSKIIINSNDSIGWHAATLLNDFVQRIAGTALPIVCDEQGKKNDVIISGKAANAGEDGFEVSTRNHMLTIRSGGGTGFINGVVHILEQYMGVNYYAYKAFTHPHRQSISLPLLHATQTPAFRFRQTFSYGNEDPVYKKWFALEQANELFVNDLWVHTFDRILPSAKYGKTHPEYYSFINGKRQPGNHSQWCLTNPEVFEVAVHNIDSIFKAHPDMKMISVSQNDGNNTNCRCDACKAVDEYEGSPSGNLIRFVNKLAERFPDKEFSTLAYLYSMHPPKHVKPLPNVNIMLCSIDSKREVPLTDNASGQDFMKALRGWSEISNNIFVWDYGINFDNMVAPFPNFHVLQKNIQLFKQYNATMVFEQVNGARGTDFSEMRAYMLGKLIWNPYLDADSLMKTFLNGYYGEAGQYLYQYHKVMQGALLAGNTPLWIYDSPVSHRHGMLNAHLMKTYQELFDQAEEAVKYNDTYLKRVRMSRLPIMYAELEMARTNEATDKDDIIKKVNLFRQRTKAYGVETLNERNNKPEDYCNLYMKRYIPQKYNNLAKNATVTWINRPNERYMPIADKALTDGLYGGTTYVEGWVGWEGEDADFILDLGEEKHVSSIEIDFLHQLGAWVLLPKGGHYSISTDGKSYTAFGSFSFDEDRDLQVKFVGGKATVTQPVKVRYIKVKVNTPGVCPAWHYGVGYPAWFFMDEITVL